MEDFVPAGGLSGLVRLQSASGSASVLADRGTDRILERVKSDRRLRYGFPPFAEAAGQGGRVKAPHAVRGQPNTVPSRSSVRSNAGEVVLVDRAR